MPQLDELTINITKLDISDLLSCWKWLLKDVEKAVLVSKMGDMFCQVRGGAILWLATDSGTLTKIAENSEEFQQLLLDDDNLDNWFLPSLINDLLDAGKYLNKNQVYSFNLMPALGGDYKVTNLEPTDVSVHFAITGQICEKIKDLPPGTSIQFNITD